MKGQKFATLMDKTMHAFQEAEVLLGDSSKWAEKCQDLARELDDTRSVASLAVIHLEMQGLRRRLDLTLDQLMKETQSIAKTASVLTLRLSKATGYWCPSHLDRWISSMTSTTTTLPVLAKRRWESMDI